MFKWLCRWGWHRFRAVTDGQMVTQGKAWAIFYTAECTRCGRKERQVLTR